MRTIYIDTREKDLPVLEKLIPEAKVVTLESGDVTFLGRGPEGKPWTIGIERKKMLNFLSALNSKQMATQLAVMAKKYSERYLVLEGDIHCSRDGLVVEYRHGEQQVVEVGGRRLYWVGLMKVLNEHAVCNGVRCFVVNNTEEYAKLVYALYDWWNDKAFDEHRMHVEVQFSPHILGLKTGALQRFAEDFDGCGPEIARRIVARFKSVEEMLDASMADWMKIDGIGEKIARGIFLVLHGRKPQAVDYIVRRRR